MVRVISTYLSRNIATIRNKNVSAQRSSSGCCKCHTRLLTFCGDMAFCRRPPSVPAGGVEEKVRGEIAAVVGDEVGGGDEEELTVAIATSPHYIPDDDPASKTSSNSHISNKSPPTQTQ